MQGNEMTRFTFVNDHWLLCGEGIIEGQKCEQRDHWEAIIIVQTRDNGGLA